MCKLTHRTSVCVAGVVASNLSLVVPFAAPMLLRIQRNDIISLFGVLLFGCSMLFLFYFCCLIFYLPFWLLTSFYSSFWLVKPYETHISSDLEPSQSTQILRLNRSPVAFLQRPHAFTRRMSFVECNWGILGYISLAP